jgi:beta-aspartyl-peptidase (threonine type)
LSRSTLRSALVMAVTLAATLCAAAVAGRHAGAAPAPARDSTTPAPRKLAFAIHGGAGTLSRDDLTPELEARYRTSLKAALDAGYAVLERGGSSLDAVETAVRLLEDDPLFNAGRGAVFTWDGRHELDASIMDGATERAGAVAGVEHVRNPISLARLVMERSPHVMLSGRGAEEFAIERGVPLVPNSWFSTERRWNELQKRLQRERTRAAGDAAFDPDRYLGTVGAVALDSQGRLAAATSTGGMTAKRWGRIGDSPLIGAGTYADARVAVSATGDGEYFIRVGVAKDVAARVAYGGQSLAVAARESIAAVGRLGGSGGVIALDATGSVAFEFNSSGMYRAVRDSSGRSEVAIFR